MLSPDLPNPFSVHKADDTVTLPAGDVPDLHAAVVRDCLAAVTRAEQARQTIGVTVVGEAGSGKSHLLARLRRHFAAVPRVVFAAVRLTNAYSGRLWRPLQTQLVGELLRQYPEPGNAANGLLRLLRNRFPEWATSAGATAGNLLSWLLGRSPDADLGPHLEEADPDCSLHLGLVRALSQLGRTSSTRLALAWLRGQSLTDDDLQRLGLPVADTSEQEQEAQAQDVVLSLLRLAAGTTTVVLCFDEIEAIQAGSRDTGVLCQFGTMLTTLLAQQGPLAVVTSVRPMLYMELRKAAEVSHLQKIAQVVTAMPVITLEEARGLARARLDAEPILRELRARRPDEPDWPFAPTFLSALHQQERRSLMPRQLIMACRAELERLKAGKPVEAARPAGRRGVSFFESWARRRDRALASPQEASFEEVMSRALPWLADLTGASLVRGDVVPMGLRDVDLVFLPRHDGQRQLGISFCNQRPGVLRWRLPRLMKQWREAKGGDTLGELVILRSAAAEDETTDFARQQLTELQTAGARTLVVGAALLAELTAFQSLLVAAQGGLLTNQNGGVIDTSQYDAWAKGNLTVAVWRFLDVLFQPAKTAEPAAVAPIAP